MKIDTGKSALALSFFQKTLGFGLAVLIAQLITKYLVIGVIFFVEPSLFYSKFCFHECAKAIRWTFLFYVYNFRILIIPFFYCFFRKIVGNKFIPPAEIYIFIIAFILSSLSFYGAYDQNSQIINAWKKNTLNTESLAAINSQFPKNLNEFRSKNELDPPRAVSNSISK